MKRITEPFGRAGLVVAVCALVFAMVGGAYAVSSSGKRQNEMDSGAAAAKRYAKMFAKRYAKEFAATFAVAGPAGANGKEGAQGPKGETGLQGLKGEKGDPGDPWTAGGTLPESATQTGYYSVNTDQSVANDLGLGEHNTFIPISFDIPLAHPLGKGQTHYVPLRAQEGKIGGGSEELCEGKTGTELEACEAGYEETLEACSGTGQAPAAAGGQLCVYELLAENMEPSPALKGFPPIGSFFIRFPLGVGGTGADTAGTTLVMKVPAAGAATGAFVWAVTG